MAGKKGYGQFCPIAKAAEVVAERWTILVLRELISGTHRFNDLRRGVPLMSPSLLSQRLKELEYTGLVERRPVAGARGAEYHLTPAGENLKPVILGLGYWAESWLKPELRDDDLDPSLLMWDVRRRVEPRGVPDGPRTTVQFLWSGVPSKVGRWWLVFENGDVDLRLKDPGYEVDLYVSGNIRMAVDVWLARRPLDKAIRSGDLKLDGQRHQVDAFPGWFALGVFAHAEA